ncbi:MAG TPA: hypothetical protein VM864_07330 [Pyrinomonadaceae bacterium]|jgi:hypothetical protein|nr:hypothetical protein [Pyrinomonadaceae bacterium]
MKITRNTFLSLSLLFAASVSAIAQEGGAGKRPAPDDATVTISISAGGVRFSAPGGVGQVRLEVFDAGGASVYSSGFQPGNVRDWSPVDKQGQALADGSYLCVVTVRGVSKRMSVKQGTVMIQGGQASLQLSEGDAVGSVEAEKSLAQVAPDAAAAGTILAHDGKVGQVISTSGALTFRVGDFFGGKDRELMRLTPEGNLGVAGTIRARGGILFDDGTVMTSSGLSARMGAGGEVQPLVAGTGTPNRITKWTDGAGTLGDSTVTEAGGNVGIGTSSPASLLHLAGPAGVNAITLNTPGSQKFRFQTVANVNNWGAFTLNGIYNAGWQLDDTSTNGWFFKLDTRGGNGPVAENGLWLYRIPSGPNPHTDELPMFGVTTGQAYFAGNLGIGTQSPQAKLDVTGDIRVTGNAVINGNIAAKYQDVAEWVPARQKIAAGTVVVLDTTRSNGVAPSGRRYDTHVAGVVSAQPGVILGQGGEGQVLVATTGRVKVKVDATRHAIKIGDLLVTSGTPGLAMKSEPIRVGGNRLHRPGTIIGKALESLSGGTGEILVLLSLQ